MKRTKVYSNGSIEINGQETGIIDWVKLHKEMVCQEANERIYIFSDGSIENLGNSYLKENDKVVAVLRTWGRGNMDTTPYAANWTTENEDGTYTTEDGRELTEDEMIDECIEDGDWTEQIEMWVEEITSQIEDAEKSEQYHD